MASYLEYLADRAVEAIHPFGSAATEVMIDMMDLHPGTKLLESGCGTGVTMVRVCSRHKVRLFGVDLLHPMLRMARRRARFCGIHPWP